MTYQGPSTTAARNTGGSEPEVSRSCSAPPNEWSTRRWSDYWRGYVAQALRGDVRQALHERVLRGFREGRTEVLVATDVAARGLDIPEMSSVMKFDLPPDPEYYVHRIGPPLDRAAAARRSRLSTRTSCASSRRSNA
jgi:hypothetical protein